MEFQVNSNQSGGALNVLRSHTTAVCGVVGMEYHSLKRSFIVLGFEGAVLLLFCPKRPFFPVLMSIFDEMVSALSHSFCHSSPYIILLVVILTLHVLSLLRYIWGGLLVLFGIFLNVYSKNRDKMRLPSVKDLKSWLVTGKKVRFLAQNV